MAPDDKLHRRNAFVIPGGLLMLISLIGILYAYGLRGDDGSCGDGTQIILMNACRSAGIALAVPLVIGVALVAVGALQYKGHGHPHLSHGTMAHFTLATLLAFVLVAVVAWAYLAYADDPENPYVFTYDETDYTYAAIAAGLVGLSVMMTLPFLVLYLSHARSVKYHVDRCGWECWDDEATPEASGGAEPTPALTPPPGWVATPEPTPAPTPLARASPMTTPDSGMRRVVVTAPTAVAPPRPAAPPVATRGPYPGERAPAPKQAAKKSATGARTVKKASTKSTK